MRFKPLTTAVAALAVLTALPALATTDATNKPAHRVDPNSATVDFQVALFEIDHTVDRRAFRRVGQELSKIKDSTLDTVTKAIAGSGKAKVLANPVFTAEEREPFSVVDLATVETVLPIRVGPFTDGIMQYASVGYRIVLVPTEIEKPRGRVDTTMQIQHSVLDGAGNVVMTDVRDRASIAPGEVYILSWVTAGKQYAMAVKAERFKKI
jgi:hypothetical protein